MTIEKAFLKVALFTRAWIEITAPFVVVVTIPVALFTRAWIEITNFALL